ncbi:MULTISPECIES: V-type ATP synthase subunit E family protein [unclassified Arthrobacter]|uniref:V-type ATP synthase subunit E family protein n=1 Tax=unclassified Arthrobacter TaxID=235627 RepID=UPI001E40EABD|nr:MULTISPECIES: V-type ATP synthase subunit E family protein [unclassified Arthrobacter]MCC9145145.1 hypothetical protein [Arthrobacter sp. zg-Y919]MDK1276373.1 V-type ATP synthase subunit E family protein [Arthrobacter sp. zg.Y919]WIB02026.1 V-type ATP synthase subunit E family protein [Arthrobacter sp. zg-Y919]
MTRLPQGADATLDPVRQALERDAETAAARSEADAQRQAADILGRAQAEADTIRRTAQREGAEAARADAVASSARARRQARRTVLSEQEHLRSLLASEVQEQVREVRRDPRYPQILRRLTAQADRVLGPMASVTESYKGGVTGTAGSRRLDLSLPTLAGQALEDHSGEVRELWEHA